MDDNECVTVTYTKNCSIHLRPHRTNPLEFSPSVFHSHMF